MNERSGSGTVVINLLDVLKDLGSEITVVVLLAYSRSPRVWFRVHAELPAGVRLETPGYIRIGSWYLNLFSPRAWMRFATRLALRLKLGPLSNRIAHLLFGSRINTDAWDLTPATPAESRQMARAVRRLNPAVVVTNYAYLGPGLQSPEMNGRRRVIQMHDLLSARVTRFQNSGIPLDCPAVTEAEELAWLNCADYILASQTDEAAEIAPRVRAQVLVQPILLPVRRGSISVDPLTSLFVGTRIRPNITGIEWFLGNVWPIVLAAEPRAQLRIAGSICALISSPPPGVTLLGVVPSLDEEMDRAAVCIVPLRIGSGIKVKLLEALASSKACVATDVGVQGLEAWAPGAIEVADDPQGFADAMLRLMRDQDLRRSRETAAAQLIQTHFSADSEASRDFARQIIQ